MPLTKSLEHKIAEFEWPAHAPYTIADALALLDRWPLPPERYFAQSASSETELIEMEATLGQALPLALRTLLLAHDGINEKWNGSGPMIGGTRDLVALGKRWKKARSRLDSDEIEERKAEGVWMVTKNLLCIGVNPDGDLFFLHTAKISRGSEHPIVIFDHSDGTLKYHQPSLGALLGWIVCDARRHPQREESLLSELFPWTWNAKVRRARKVPAEV